MSTVSAANKIPQALLDANLNGQKAEDAIKVFSFLPDFDKVQYCWKGCSYLTPFHRKLSLLTHPDKLPFGPSPEGVEKAQKISVLVNSAKVTLCEENLARELCEKAPLYQPIYNFFFQPAVDMRRVYLKSGIDGIIQHLSKKLDLNHQFKMIPESPGEKPCLAFAEYLSICKEVPYAIFNHEIHLSYREAFQYVLDRFKEEIENNRPFPEGSYFAGTHLAPYDDRVMCKLKKIEVEPGVSLLQKVVSTLEKEGIIRFDYSVREDAIRESVFHTKEFLGYPEENS